MEGVTLLDFGVARGSGQTKSRQITHTGVVVGTPGYMAPEQARGQTEVSPSVDIFALGCVLFECLTGTSPFAGEYLETILVKILFEAAPSLRSLRPSLPESLDQLIAQMLCKDPSRRIPDAAALLRLLDQLELEGKLDSSTQPGLQPRTLTGPEQQLVSVLVSWTSAQLGHEQTTDLGTEQRNSGQLDSLCKELRALGVRSEVLAEGPLVATLTAERENSATDQVQRAARCALLLRERIPQAVVALATGRAVIEGQLPMGEAISRAVRLARSHSAGAMHMSAVIVDRVTAGLLDVRFQTAPVSDDEEAALLLGEHDTDESRRLLGRPTACVGRDGELGMLESGLGACVNEGTPRVIVVLAPPGMGKSRLRQEFLRRVAVQHSELPLLLGRGDLMSASTPFFLIRQALLFLCGVQPTDPLEVRQRKLQQRIGRVTAERERNRTVAFLGELCGLPFPDSMEGSLRAARNQPRVMQEAIRHAFVRWLRAECEVQSVMFVIEDLHWADMASVLLIDFALRELHDSPLFVLALSRPEGVAQFPKLWPESAQTIPLRPLSKRARENLVRQVLSRQAPADVVARIAEQSAGNALYLEELIRAAVEGKGEEPPPTVLAMLQARIGRLEPGARRALRAASVFGETCWAGGVAALLGTEIREATRMLEMLSELELLDHKVVCRFADETEFQFRHGLMREAAYDLLSDEDRALAHAVAGRFLEQAGERSAVLAYHFQRGRDTSAARHHYEKAGDEAARVSVLDEARRHYAAALEYYAEGSDDPERRRKHADLLIKQVSAGLMIEPAAVQLQRLSEVRAQIALPPGQASIAASLAINLPIGNQPAAAALANPEDALRIARTDYLHGRVLYYDNQPAEALRYHQRVLPIAERLSDSNLRALNALAIGRAYVLAGRMGPAWRLLAGVIEPMADLGDLSEWSRCFSFYAMALAGAGRYREALAQLERGLSVATQAEQTAVLILYHTTKSGAHLQGADWPRTLDAAQTALELAAQSTDKAIYYVAEDSLAWAASYLGQIDKALGHRAHARELRESLGGGICRDWYEAGEAEILLNAGQSEAALRQAQSVIAASRQDDLPFSQAVAQRVWACALGRLGGELAEIDAHFSAAVALCQEHEQVVNEALTEVWWGRILRERSFDAQAYAHLARGIAMLDATGCENAAQLGRDLAHGPR